MKFVIKKAPYSLCVTVWNRTLKLWFNHLFECEDISSEFWIYVYVGKAVCNFTSYLKIRIFFLQHLVHVLCKFTSTYSGAMLIIILHFYDIVWYCVTMLWYFFSMLWYDIFVKDSIIWYGGSSEIRNWNHLSWYYLWKTRFHPWSSCK